MTTPQTIPCDDCQERLHEFALDELDGNARDRVAAHLAGGCAACNAELSQIVADLAALAYALPTASPPAHIEHSLMQRIAAQSPVVPAAVATPSRKPAARRVIGLAAALAAGLAGLAAWTIWDRSVAERNRAEYLAELKRRVDQAGDSQHFAAIPQLTFVALRGPAPQNPVRGYVVTDNVARQWHVFVFSLPKLPDDRTYQLWFVTPDNGHVPAGVATPGATGSITQLVNLPTDVPQVVGLAISDEPPTGSPQPTGEHFFQANLP